MKLQLRCQQCRKHVAGSRRAVVHIPYADFTAVERDRRAWTERNTNEDGVLIVNGRQLMTIPKGAVWLVHCDGCNPHKEPDGSMCAGCYWFSANRCTTAADLLYWTAHLMSKNWLPVTNWDDFIRAAAASTGATDP